jgi:ATP/ADP translocase
MVTAVFAQGNTFTAIVGSVMAMITLVWYAAVQKLAAAYQDKLSEKKNDD